MLSANKTTEILKTTVILIIAATFLGQFASMAISVFMLLSSISTENSIIAAAVLSFIGQTDFYQANGVFLCYFVFLAAICVVLFMAYKLLSDIQAGKIISARKKAERLFNLGVTTLISPIFSAMLAEMIGSCFDIHPPHCPLCEVALFLGTLLIISSFAVRHKKQMA